MEAPPLKLSGHTKPFAVLGHPIGHTLSPVMHNRSFRSLGLDAIYLAFDVHPDRLMPVLAGMRDMGFGGVNLTIPLKEVAFRGLTDLAETAARLRAVNTVQFLANGGLRGHSTDGAGFLAAVREAFDATVAGRSIFLLGCGGAGRAVAITCAMQGAARIVLADADAERVQRLAQELAEGPGCAARGCPPDSGAWRRACGEADLVVQATPVGMKEDDAPLLGPDAFRPGQMAYDLVYMYPQTGFMRAARQAGAVAANGLGMLLHQGAASFAIWTGRQADVTAMRAALEETVYGRDKRG